MAKSFSEKAAWIEAVERVTLMKESPSKAARISRAPTREEKMESWDILASFSADIHVYCALTLPSTGDVIYGELSGSI